jgi:hypothetical protein
LLGLAVQQNGRSQVREKYREKDSDLQRLSYERGAQIRLTIKVALAETPPLLIPNVKRGHLIGAKDSGSAAHRDRSSWREPDGFPAHRHLGTCVAAARSKRTKAPKFHSYIRRAH